MAQENEMKTSEYAQSTERFLRAEFSDSYLSVDSSRPLFSRTAKRLNARTSEGISVEKSRYRSRS